MNNVLQICGAVVSISAAVGVFVKIFVSIRKIRDGQASILEGQKCLLRQAMLDTYYKCREKGEIRQYRLENFMMLYQAYKALGGNSFIDHIKEEVKSFEVVT